MEHRNTVQKQMVLDAVRRLAGHSTAEEVYEYIHSVHPAVGKSTVYRNLSILAEEGAIRKVEIPGGPDRFDHTCAEHYHVLCTECGDVLDVDKDPVTGLMEQIRDHHGVKFLSYDILFKGICPECLRKAGAE